ncbi:MAG: hypothetical protein LQ346_002275 [Caloplaca aetnensis]|nr:MAG: hypothetical protein LQ346_002275 [Caloplaca aetnensis]
MAASEWPRCPDLQGRPLDTALLLHRDYVANFCKHIYQNRARGSDDLVPLDAFLPLLQSTTSIGHVLANRVDGLQNGFDTFAKIQQSIDGLEDQSRRLWDKREMLGPYRVERERATTVEVKEELDSLNLSDADSPWSRSDRADSFGSSSRSSDTPFARRGPKASAKGKNVTIKIHDPGTLSELRRLSNAQLAHRLQRDLGGQNIPFQSVFLLDSGDVRVVTLSLKGARTMKNSQMWKPRLFGPGAFTLRSGS